LLLALPFASLASALPFAIYPCFWRCHLLPLLLALPFAVHFANAQGAKVHFVLIFSLRRMQATGAKLNFVLICSLRRIPAKQSSSCTKCNVALVGLASAKQAQGLQRPE
jgi:hypothetical protein